MNPVTNAEPFICSILQQRSYQLQFEICL